MNDNSPDWERFSSPVLVREDASMNHVVTTVLARDSDSGMYGEVAYHITSGADNKFDINTETVRHGITFRSHLLVGTVKFAFTLSILPNLILFILMKPGY